MQKITPYLWFEDKAEEAMRFYVSLFADAGIESITHYPAAMVESMPRMAGMSGKVLNGMFRLAGHTFMAMDGGAMAKPTPAVSFFVNCRSAEEVDRLYAALAEDGQVRMPLQAYPFSDRYAWVADRYGIDWQLNLASSGARIRPSLLFVGDQNGRAEEAIQQYTALFPDSRVIDTARYAPGEPGTPGTLKYAAFALNGQEFVAMDSNLEHGFTFTEAISLYVDCEDQAEVDRLWDALSEDGEVLMCGWLKDRYGLTWQIIPRALPRLMNDPDPARAQRVMQAMLSMRKIDVAGLERAYAQEGQPR